MNEESPAARESPARVSFAPGSVARARQTLHAIRTRLGASREATESRSLLYLDTFDWRLFEAGGTLTATKRDERWLVEWESASGERQSSLAEVPPEFAWDLPPGRLRETLAPALEVRRLLPLVRLELTVQSLRVRDGADKVVADVELERATASDPQRDDGARAIPVRLSLVPVRGYDEEFRSLRLVVERELGLVPDPSSRLQHALEAVGRRPLDYSSKLRLALDPRGESGAAVRRILLTLLETMRANEDGLRRNLDPEFLHDFRVAVRRTRTCLGQLRDVLPSEVLDRYRGEFSWLGEITGPARDLDVHLIRLEDYRAELPQEDHDGLLPLRDLLARRRRSEQERLVEALASERYRALVGSWRRVLRDETSTAWPDAASRPLAAFACERVGRRFERVLARGAKIGKDSPPAKLHRLRVDCKKLRYLLEFFRNIYRPEDVTLLIKELKRLQDNLGELNDLAVQEQTLARSAEQLQADGSATAASLLLFGRLLEKLAGRKKKERSRFASRFARFASRGNRERMVRMLKAARDSASDVPGQGAS